MITFNGAGGINHEVFMLRKAPQQIYMNDGPVLDRIAAVFGEDPALNRSACSPRDHPEVLKTDKPIKAVRRDLVILERTKGSKQKEILSKRIETLPNTRTSTLVNPLSYGILPLGGAPSTFHCVKHASSIAIGETLKYREENMRRERQWHYPWEALREAIINALAHRDWTIAVDIELSVYSNRLEIISPGKLQNSMTIEKMIAGQRSPRNPLIMDILRDYAYVDARGMGVSTKIIPLMKKFNHSEPVFELTDDYLKTTLFRKAPIENILRTVSADN